MDNLNADFSIENNQPLEAQFTLNPNNFACSFEVYAAGTVWGSIAGDINNQIDLKNALDLKADKSELDLAVSELNVNIQNEATTRAESDTLLQNNINTLSQTVTANYNALDGKIDNEISSRTLADTTLQNNIDAEALARQNADGSLQGNIDTLSATVTSNYNTLDGKISTNTNNITTLQNTINTYGDIVAYNAADFATSTQGALADSALQPGDNISALVNNVGYITSASLPTDYVPNTRTINGYALTSNITLSYSDVGALSSSTTINDLTTTAQQNALNSGATATNIGQITTNANDISDIQDLIPSQASSSNQLADKDFVNSSIATNTANFIGTFNSVAELEAYSGTLTNNDYAFVATTDSAGNTLYDRYKYNADTQEWLFEYELNNSSFTAQQWASINSGATTTNIGQIATNASDISDLQTNKQDVLTAGANIQIINNVISATDTTYTAGTGISIVNGVISNTQTSAEWGNITGVLSSQTDLQDALDDKYDASNPSGFITGITSSDVTTALGYTPYNSTNPNGYITISALNGYATETWVTNQGYITGITSSDVTTALGYTPYNATNPNGYITASALTGYATETYVDTGLATKQATLVSGTNIKTINNISLLGSGNITITSAPDIDNKSITTNSDDELQTVGVIDQNNTTNAIKTWTGTKAQYDAIVSKDANTLYWLTDVKIIYLGDTPVGNFSGNRNISEIVTSTIPLTDAGLHLLDGALINGSGIYSDFVDYIANIYKTKDRVYNPSAFTVVGSPTITADGIASGFSSSNYIDINPISLSNKIWEVKLNVSLSGVSANYIFSTVNTTNNGNGFLFSIENVSGNLKCKMYASSNSTSWDILNGAIGSTILSLNTKYFIKIGYNGTAFYTALSTDDINYTQDIYVISSNNIYEDLTSTFRIGNWRTYGANLYASIDLKQFSITVDGVEVFSGSNPANYFTTEALWQQSVTTYGVCGKFVYDSVNNTVRLPKVTGIIEGTTDASALGDLVEASYPSHYHYIINNDRVEARDYITISNTNYLTCRAHRTSYDESYTFQGTDTVATLGKTSNSGSGSTVQPQTIKAFYYIVIANSTKTDIQVDIDEIATDLNGKANTDLTNVNDTGYIKMASASMPSTTTIFLTVGASGTTYTAPADGWVTAVFTATGANGWGLLTSNNNVGQHCFWPTTGGGTRAHIPVRKGSTFRLDYGSVSCNSLAFTYAVGSESEAS